MMKWGKAALATTCAIGALGVAVTGASANILSVSNTRFRVVWTPMTMWLQNTEFFFRCNVTLEGSFHSATIAKVSEATIGRVSRASIAGCGFGVGATILQTSLPWSIRYDSFEGSLPTPEGFRISIRDIAFRVDTIITPPCLFRDSGTEEAFTATAHLERDGTVSGLQADSGATVPFFEGIEECSSFGSTRFEGTGALTLLGSSSTRIRITLIDTPPTLSPSPVEFGRVEIGTLTRRTVTLRAGSAALTVNSISVTSRNYFAITDPNRCVGARLAVNATCSFSAIFAAPEEVGRSVSDTVTVATSVRSVAATLRGTT
jgi:hypothetical protein